MNDRFTEILDALKALHAKKSQDYGGVGDPYANVRGSEAWGIPGWLGAMIRANDKIKRLQSFAANGRLANEGVEDAFKDLAVYSIIGLILYEKSLPQTAGKLVAVEGDPREYSRAELARRLANSRTTLSAGDPSAGLPDATGWSSHS